MFDTVGAMGTAGSAYMDLQRALKSKNLMLSAALPSPPVLRDGRRAVIQPYASLRRAMRAAPAAS
jgi:hypothetical protein